MQIKDRSSIHENKEVEAFWKEQLSSEILDFSVFKFNSDYRLNKETPCEYVQVIVNVEFSKSIQKISKSQDLLLFSWFQAA
ncbi:peptide synthetase, partial [Bacillus cereus]|nr:peptide synthetase [Bacillus cereus]